MPLGGLMDIGPALRDRRRQLGLTQRELAELSGASLRFIRDLEHGKPTVQLASVRSVASTLGLELTLAVREPSSGAADV